MNGALTSLLSSFSDPVVHDLVDHLRQQGLDVRFVDGEWDARLRSMQDGATEGGWVCGLIHMTLQETGPWAFTAVAAPRSQRAGHAGSPVYFGDVVVAGDSPHLRFEALAGTTFAYNEEESLSGHRMMVDHLASIGADLCYFASTLKTGSHLASLRAVIDGRADCAIIDSTLLDAGCPGADEVRAVHSVGPYPAPPLVVRAATAAGWCEAVTGHPGWAPMTDADYQGLPRRLQG